MNPIEERIEELKRVPGRVQVKIMTYQKGDPRFEHVQPDGTKLSEGANVAEWRRRFGGDETVWTDPIQGKEHRVSIAEYAHLGDDVMLRIAFAFEPDRPIAPQHENLFTPGAIAERARGLVR